MSCVDIQIRGEREVRDRAEGIIRAALAGAGWTVDPPEPELQLRLVVDNTHREAG